MRRVAASLAIMGVLAATLWFVAQHPPATPETAPGASLISKHQGSAENDSRFPLSDSELQSPTPLSRGRTTGEPDALRADHNEQGGRAANARLSIDGSKPGQKSETANSLVLTEVSISQDVVGKAFPLSETLANLCKPIDGRRLRASCERANELLGEFKLEPREEPWASNIEEKFRRMIATRNPGYWQVRALECRTSLCALETTTTDRSPFAPGYAGHRDLNLFSMIRVGTFELNSDSSQTLVMLHIFSRR
jgi:hypothetical protein